MEKILTGNIWKQAKKYYGHDEPKIACVAYVHTTGIDLQSGDLLICDASRQSIAFGRTSAKVLKEYFERGVNIYTHDCLHAKMLHAGSVLVLGSANLSASSETDLTEAAIITDNLVLLGHAKILCSRIKKETRALLENDIKKLLEIEVIRKPRAVKKGKRKNFSITGDQCWYIPLFEMSEGQVRNLDEETAKQSAQIAKEKNIPLEQIHKIRLSNRRDYSKKIQPGDQVVSKFSSRKRTRIWMYSPVTVLSVGSAGKGKFKVLYYDTAEETSSPWSTFKEKMAKTHLPKLFTNRTKIISLKDAQLVKRLVNKK